MAAATYDYFCKDNYTIFCDLNTKHTASTSKKNVQSLDKVAVNSTVTQQKITPNKFELTKKNKKST